MPESKRKAMLKVFSKLKQRIIWKWETSMDDAPRDGFIKTFQMLKYLIKWEKIKSIEKDGF